MNFRHEGGIEHPGTIRHARLSSEIVMNERHCHGADGQAHEVQPHDLVPLRQVREQTILSWRARLPPNFVKVPGEHCTLGALEDR